MSVLSEQELKLMQMHRDAQQYSYELIQKLTFFVIGIELVFCGYILLYADKFGAIKYSSFLFLIAGIGALSGLLWRLFYNQVVFDSAHENVTNITKLILKLQKFCYSLFLILSIGFMVFAVISGFIYIRGVEVTAKPVIRLEESVKEGDSITSNRENDKSSMKKVPNKSLE